MNLQNVTFPIELSVYEAELILNGLINLPKKDADPVFAKVQQTAMQAIQKVQSQPVVEVSPTEQASTAQAQAAIDQAEANQNFFHAE